MFTTRLAVHCLRWEDGFLPPACRSTGSAVGQAKQGEKDLGHQHRKPVPLHIFPGMKMPVGAS